MTDVPSPHGIEMARSLELAVRLPSQELAFFADASFFGQSRAKCPNSPHLKHLGPLGFLATLHTSSAANRFCCTCCLSLPRSGDRTRKFATSARKFASPPFEPCPCTTTLSYRFCALRSKFASVCLT